MIRDNPNSFRNELIELFKILDQMPENRGPYLSDEILEFPYVNGGLFEDENIIVPRITKDAIDIILDKASANFDWSEISPTIFGGVFESTLTPVTRRKGEMHYTSVENIHKVIDNLFLNDLRNELNQIKEIMVIKTRNKKLEEYQNKLSNLKFLEKKIKDWIHKSTLYITQSA